MASDETEAERETQEPRERMMYDVLSEDTRQTDIHRDYVDE